MEENSAFKYMAIWIREVGVIIFSIARLNKNSGSISKTLSPQTKNIIMRIIVMI
jgi:hypothetical protein